MEEKKTIKISLSTFFLILAIIAICVMGYFIYKLNDDKTKATEQVSELNNQVAKLENSMDNLQEKANKIPDTSNNTKLDNEKTEENKSNSVAVTEKQTLTGAGYTITLYSNNEVKLAINESDLRTIIGSTSVNVTSKNCTVTGLSGKVNKMYQGNKGTGVSPITFFIMEDGTVEYIQPIEMIIDNNYTVPSIFKINGKIDNLENVVDIKTNSRDVLIAVTKDGKEIKFMNEWMENM